MTASTEQIGDSTLYLGDCLEILPTLGKVDAVVTDPPYGEGFDFNGDATPQGAAELFSAFLRRFNPEPGTYMAVFWTMRNLDILLDTVRGVGWAYMRILAMHTNGTARPHLAWLPRLQPIVIFRMGVKPSELHDAFSQFLCVAIERSGLSLSQIAKHLDCDSRLVMKWSRFRDPSWCLPTARFYPQLKALISLGDDFDKQLSGRTSERSHSCDIYQHDLYLVRGGKTKTDHPAEKPLHVVLSLCRGFPSTTVLDPFMGSGTTGVACAKMGRKFVGIEIEPKYFDIACKRIEEAYRQPDMFIERPKPAEQPDMLKEAAE